MRFQQHNPPHPGVVTRRTHIEPFSGLSANKIAYQLGVIRSTFDRLLNGAAGISPQMAVRLSRVLSGSAESWLTLQESCDLWEARQSVNAEALIPIDFSQFAGNSSG